MTQPGRERAPFAAWRSQWHSVNHQWDDLINIAWVCWAWAWVRVPSDCYYYWEVSAYGDVALTCTRSDAAPTCTRSDAAPTCTRSDAALTCTRSDAALTCTRSDAALTCTRSDAAPTCTSSHVHCHPDEELFSRPVFHDRSCFNLAFKGFDMYGYTP